MNQREGGCCIARYAGGGAYHNNKNYTSKVDRIMLRFRPIAPKPPTNIITTNNNNNNTVSVSGNSGSSTNSNNTPPVIKTCRGAKRKHVVLRKQHNKRSTKTLSLLPETPETSNKKNFPVWLSFGDHNNATDYDQLSTTTDHVTFTGRPLLVVESWVKVECVTETWVNEGSYIDIDVDTCPGFVSDGLNRVRWINGAYKKMVLGESRVAGKDVRAPWLVVEQGVELPLECMGFTCRVRVITCVGKEKSSKTMPCDVWRMDSCGGFAWRLDTTAALSLGR